MYIGVQPWTFITPLALITDTKLTVSSPNNFVVVVLGELLLARR
jgi:hypothetical protein